MKPLQSIDSFDLLKLLGDPRRLKILRLLMAKPATLSQLGKTLGIHAAKVRHHLKQLEEAGLIELSSTRAVRGFIEKYYAATAQAYCINLTITPAHTGKNTFLVTGSDDLALELLTSALSEHKAGPDLQVVPVGSLDGLISLRQGLGQIAGCHLYDPPSGDYNLPYVRHLFPDLDIRVITLARREQGLLTAPGNPLGIRDLPDIFNNNARFINRNKGSGTRIWLDQRLRDEGLPIQKMRGYDREVNTHMQVAQTISKNQADTGLGLLAAARKYDLDFVPLFEERFDLAIPTEHCENPRLLPMFEYLHSGEFRQNVGVLGGYDATDAGGEHILA
ncbi:MAG: ArsR family transcriptional regulator [Chloroflexi bacterium]|nr:MAG: ArsR family transcriptional regulator [Chloroflexota bacterium]MBL1196430.1 ArsR family transcriptional regulator [Chloroflexota bacterium]NOH13725.1 helix-turn-helix domain-containing protein [Chloroflexota bacterium]